MTYSSAITPSCQGLKPPKMEKSRLFSRLFCNFFCYRRNSFLAVCNFSVAERKSKSL
jgi:hypothetical protein